MLFESIYSKFLMRNRFFHLISFTFNLCEYILSKIIDERIYFQYLQKAQSEFEWCGSEITT